MTQLTTVERLALQIQSCKMCELSKTQIPLPGYSPDSAHTSLAYVLAAPSKETALSGYFYEGIQGEYLLKLFKESKISLADMFLTSIIKCPTKDYKEPTEGVIKTCSPWFLKEIEAVKPKFMFSAGSTVTRYLLNIKKKTIKLEDYIGKEYPYGNDYTMVVPVYSIQYCLRHGYPTQKKMQEILSSYSKRI